MKTQKNREIPERVKIGGFDYTVHVVDNFISDDECDGAISYNDCKIMVKESKGIKWQAFWHEVMHGIDYAFNADSLTDEQIERLSQGVYQVLKDNFGIGR